MSLAPLSEFQLVARSTSARAFAERHPRADAVLLEPWERERDYSRGVHPEAIWMMLERELNRPVPIGRDARSTILLDHAAVSRLHAIMAWTGDAWKIMDRSANGVWLNGERLPREQPVSVPYGAQVRLGRAYVLRMLAPEAFHALAGNAGAGGRGAPPPPSDPRAETWRFPAVQSDGPLTQSAPPPGAPAPVLPAYAFDAPGEAARPESPSFAPPQPAGAFELDFDFESAPPVLGSEAVIGGEDPAPAQPSPPRQLGPTKTPGTAPAPPRLPRSPSSSPDPEFTDEIEFDFGSKFDQDGRGGFA